MRIVTPVSAFWLSGLPREFSEFVCATHSPHHLAPCRLAARAGTPTPTVSISVLGLPARVLDEVCRAAEIHICVCMYSVCMRIDGLISLENFRCRFLGLVATL